jgi:hydrogenase maturation protein HypF
MMRDIETVLEFCAATQGEQQLLSSSAAPIVLLKMCQPADWGHVAPGLKEMGVMLPYSPLHQLLSDGVLRVLVMTSGNVSDEPIAGSNQDALSRLGNIADLFLCHNREIVMKVDDSLVRHTSGTPRILRRSRGYTPTPIELPFQTPDLLACGADLKGAPCLISQGQALISQHLGDLENSETLLFFEETLAKLKAVYRIQPVALAHDLHPDYITTRWAERQSLPRVAVRHHHAHCASCMAENGLNERVIGVTFDGTGYGTDGQVWGGEFLVGDYRGFKRAAHIRYVPLIGGEQAIRQPWRMAATHLMDAFGVEWREERLPLWDAASERGWRAFEALSGRAHASTSSCGRLFDAVAALTGCCYENSYEGEAATLLEASADMSGPTEPLPWNLDISTTPWTIDVRSMVREIVLRIGRGDRISSISRDFHETVAEIVVATASKLRDENGVNAICLSGGTFQNATLLERSITRLAKTGFRVYSHSRVPTNDGGISLGQAAVLGRFLEDNR